MKIENEEKLKIAWEELNKAVQEKNYKKATKLLFWIKAMVKQNTINY